MGKKARKKKARQEARARRQGRHEQPESMYKTRGGDRKNRVNELNDLWLKTKQRHKEHVAAKLTFGYVACPALREAVIDGLALWRFYHEEARDERGEDRAEFFKPFLAECREVAVVAMLEQLPTSVWRRILWRENIDYVTPESFLRRLTAEQFNAIRENFLDLSERRQIPRVFTRWEIWRYKLTPENPFIRINYSWQTEGHGAAKGSWSYNLLKLDFGFNQYPKGEADDYKLVEVSPMRFLSEKNHADDFVVDDETGKYWWFYRKARSNSVWKPERLVELNDYICPGFWYTLIIHAIFWIVSPIFAGSYASTLFAGFKPLAYQGLKTIVWWAGMPLAVFTPIWLCAAVVRGISEGAGVWEYVKTGLLIILVIILVICVGLICAIGVYPLGKWLLGQLGSVHTLIIAALLLIAPAYRLVQRLRHGKWPPTIGEEPALMIISGFLAFVSAVIHLIYNHRASVWRAFLAVVGFFKSVLLIIGAVLLIAVKAITDFAVIIGWLWLMFLPGIFLIALTWYLERLPEEKQKKLDRLIDQYSQYAAKGILLIFMGIFFWALNIHSASSGAKPFREYIWPLAATTLAFVYYALIYLLLRKNSPVEKRLKTTVWRIDRYRCSYTLNYDSLRENTWLRDLPADELSAAIKAFEEFVQAAIYSDRECRRDAFDDLVRHAGPETLPYLKDYTASLELLTSDQAYAVLRIMIRQPVLTFDQALAELERRRQSNEKLKRFLRRLFFVPIKLYQALRFIVIEVPLTVKRIWELFNKRCPIRFKSRQLSFN